MRALSRRTVLSGLALAPLVPACTPRRALMDVLRIGIAGAPDSLDPLQGQFAASALIYKQIYTPLTDYGVDGGLAPGLAQSWQVSPDGLRWTFTLRPNMRWSDGQPLGVEDVLFSVRRALDPDTGYADAGDFYALENAQESLAGTVPPSAVGVRQSGPDTLVFHLTKPVGVFPELMREFYPQPRHKIEQAGSRWPLTPDFVGSGPYRVDVLAQQRMTLKANPHAIHPPHIAAIDVSFVDDAATRARMVRAGDLDLTEDPPANQIAMLRARKDVRLYDWPAPRFVYLKINHARAPFNDVRVRRALSLAVDRDFLAHKVLGDTAQAAEALLPLSGAPYRPGREARLAEARHLLAAAGQETLRMTLLHAGDVRERMAVIMASDWREIGVQCALTAADSAGLYTFIDEGAFDLALASFDRGLKRAPWRLIEPFAKDGFAANFNWHNKIYDQTVAAARAEADPVLRDKLARDAAQILHDDAAIVPLVFEKTFWLANSALQGLEGALPPVQWARLYYPDQANAASISK